MREITIKSVTILSLRVVGAGLGFVFGLILTRLMRAS